ncbi:uncharacterized protein BXZ73DRAFT_78411 [Epithele typhae]|uniref:uncharacterized protein n=1 Tax=Epithele typhae TaxID=378194 RepID=UPI0020078DF9|nr:uncharacterized protein BXZ73DRAFT_78411 [Epithele typhae]KAH9927956.1 hypothetical protein BXZ73DRAFT_78411 [Epithele typhae]
MTPPRPFARLAALVVLAAVPTALAAPTATDPCAKVAGKTFVPPADALACLKAFPLNETIRDNVLTVVDRVFNFYTFEDYYLNSPPPFQESTVNIRAQIARQRTAKYKTDYDFNHDLYLWTSQLNDGHTRWFPSCTTAYQNLLPAPVVTLEVNGVQSVFVAPDSADFLALLGDDYTGYFDSIGFDFRRLAGARVLKIAGQDPYAYADMIAHTQSGNYLDHGVRVNSAFSSYRISGTDFSQRFGDIAGPAFPDLESLTMELLLVNATKPETVTIPYLASYAGGVDFTNKDDFWANLCAANNGTNGVDFKASGAGAHASPSRNGKLAMAKIVTDGKASQSVGLPTEFQPTVPQVNGSTGVIKSYMLEDKKTAVMFVGSFEPDDFDSFQTDTVAAFADFKAAGATRLIVDLSNNGGGFVCLGHFLHEFLSGTKSLGGFQNPGYQSTMRASPLAQKILASDIALGLNGSFSFYTPDNWAFLNNTGMPLDFDFMTPSTTRTINGKQFVESQRFADVCPVVVDIPEEPFFPPENIAIVGNANCASTCAMFSTLMNERHNTKIAIFGGKPGLQMQFKGMAGNQVLEWFDIDSEVKTANLKDDPLAPPDLLINANFRHNWRIAYSFLDESTPIEYKSELPHFRFPYTPETYNNPQALWDFA